MTLNNIPYRFIAAVMFLRLIPAGAQAFTPLVEADFDRIDTYIETQLKEADIPGAALVIVERGEIVHLRGFGIADSDGRPVTVETSLVIGSVSKSFTGLAVMQLVEAGKIELDAPVQEYLPWFRVADPEASRQMKVRHLLNHTSGFSTFEGRTHYGSRDMSDEAIEHRVRALRRAKLTAPVGQGTDYSNVNYAILGAIIESVSGRSYENHIQESIFDPLDMANSFTSVEAAKQHGFTPGYRYWFGKPFAASGIPYPRGDIAAAHLISCAKDMGNYLLAHMNGGTLGDARILSEAGVSMLHTPAEKHLYYAMGWEVWVVNGIRVVTHGGITPSSYVRMAIVPEHQRAYVILINAMNHLSGPDVGSLASMVQLHVLGIPAASVSKAPRIHYQLALLCGLLLYQVVGFALYGRRLYRWRKRADSHPPKRRAIMSMRTGLLSTVDVCIAGGLLWWVPRAHESTFAGVMIYAPDAGWLLLLNGVLALISLAISMVVTVLLIRRSDSIKSIDTRRGCGVIP